MAGEKRASPRVREHIDRLRAAGMDTARFFDALTLLRDDSALAKPHRDAIYKLIAMESFIWYLEALRNEPIDREKLLAQAKEIAAQPAIVKRTPGDQATQLAKADIGKRERGGAKTPATSPPAAKPSASTAAGKPPASTAAPATAPQAAAPRPAAAPAPKAPPAGSVARAPVASTAKPTPKK